MGLIVAYPYLGAFVVMVLIYVSENKKRKKPQEDSAVYVRLFEDTQNIVESSGLLEGTYKRAIGLCISPINS